MAGTAASTRKAPQRRFENYVLTRVVDSSVGLTKIPDALFTQLSGPADYTGYHIGQGYCDDGLSNKLNLGFDFNLDGIVYKQFVACTNGWLVLVDPTTGTFSSSEVLNSAIYINDQIKPTFTSKAVLLAPWFDDLRNALNDPLLLSSNPFSLSGTKAARVAAGLDVPPTTYNPTSYGVSYFYDTKSPKGRRLIVRWASVSNYVYPTSVVRFEVVLYENGTIEYRYTPKQTIPVVPFAFQVESATVGIFMPNGTYRFRDFSTGLGYRENSRQEYIYGGYVYTPSYFDGVAVYTNGLRPDRQWPGLQSAGCILRFSPPVNRRKVLPRKLATALDSRQSYPHVARTGDSRLGTGGRGFDDRLSPTYATSAPGQVNYPSTLTRFFGGNGLGTSERQNLFAGDFLVTGSVVKSAIDQYVDESPETYIEPFSEVARFEQGPSAQTEKFFVSGSSQNYVLGEFTQRLTSKTQIRISLPIAYNIPMPASTSSIFYYNSRVKTWEVPQRSTYQLASIPSQFDSTPPNPLPAGSAGGDWRNPQVDALAQRLSEDYRGFGAVGNIISSGSHTPVHAFDQTDSAIRAVYAYGSIPDFAGKTYVKSIRNNEEYSPAPDETFTIPITTPFLIEKAVFEIPLAMGPGWFSDLTKCFSPINLSGLTTAFDLGGPGITVALHRQVQLSKDLTKNRVTSRDLILTGTITHTLDDMSRIEFSNFQPHTDVFVVRPVGFRAYGGVAGAVVKPNASMQFTGSVVVQAEALSSAGLHLVYVKDFMTQGEAANRAAIRAYMTSTPTVTLTTNPQPPAQYTQIMSVAPFGRGGTGFQQSGRCILGNEYAALQGFADPSGRIIKNPFLTSSLSTQQLAALNTSGFRGCMQTVIPVVSHFPSPYLVMPGDKLVLSISKTRPHLYGAGNGVPQFSGSNHDVVLKAGDINITLYGSLIQEGDEFHDTLNQQLGSNAVHELIGAEPVLDEFESAYSNEYTGSFTDNVMLGTLTTTSTRDRKLSWLNARNAPALTTNVTDTQINPWKGFRLEPWWERAGNVRTSQFKDSTERFWDSMMPGVAECFAADGTGIFISPPGTFGDFRKIDVELTGAISSFNPKKVHPGWIMMDNLNPTLAASDTGKITNGNWNKSFPFEPRYQNVSRQLDVSKSLLATYIYQPYGSPVVAPIKPTRVNGLIFGTVALGTAVLNYDYFFFSWVWFYTNYPMYEWFVDANLSSKVIVHPGYVNATIPSQLYASGSTPVDDTSRALFGFGDRNTCYEITNADTTKTVLGTNHFPDARDVEGPHPDGQWTYFDSSNFRFSPRIRGWKYGVYSGLPAFSKAYWRRGKFGQFRDMLEQRPYTKFYQSPEGSANVPNFQQGVQPAAVTVTFLDPSSGRLTSPTNTWSSNLHFECTSSMPFFDGIILNRPTITPANLNLHPSGIKSDTFGNIVLW